MHCILHTFQLKLLIISALIHIYRRRREYEHKYIQNFCTYRENFISNYIKYKHGVIYCSRILQTEEYKLAGNYQRKCLLHHADMTISPYCHKTDKRALDSERKLSFSGRRNRARRTLQVPHINSFRQQCSAVNITLHYITLHYITWHQDYRAVYDHTSAKW
jgi:hypothetical protein